MIYITLLIFIFIIKCILSITPEEVQDDFENGDEGVLVSIIPPLNQQGFTVSPGEIIWSL